MRKNYHARSLKSGSANALGVLYYGSFKGTYWWDFWGRVIFGVSAAATRHGLDFVLIGNQEEDDPRLIERAISGLKERRIDGLVVPGILDLVPYAAVLRATEAPVVVALRYDHRPLDLPVVQLDERPGLVAAAAHLKALGHRRIAWINLPGDGGGRGRSFQAILGTLGLSCIDVQLGIEGAAWKAMTAAERGREGQRRCLARGGSRSPRHPVRSCATTNTSRTRSMGPLPSVA